jgi:hypothetical protein
MIRLRTKMSRISRLQHWTFLIRVGSGISPSQFIFCLWNPDPDLVASQAGIAELEFFKSLLGLGTKEEEGHRTDPPGYIGWRNSFLGIDSGAPYTFKNTGHLLFALQ